MENKNYKTVAEILKDCPKGMELYSPICGECRLIKIYNSLGFDVINNTNDIFNFSYDGRYNLNGECCIFPSKDQRDWSKFQRPFKDGDIIYVKSKDACGIEVISIYKNEDNERFYAYCSVSSGKYYSSENVNGLIHNLILLQKDRIDIIRFATEIEKDELFDAIKKNGYKWSFKTKTLEKLFKPTFKVGDKIKEKNERFPSTRTIDSYVEGIGYFTTINDWVRIEDQDNWELVPTHNFKVGDRIKYKKHDIKYRIINEENDMYIVERCSDNFTCHMSFKYVDDEYELVPNKFDISTLKPFESKVLVRDVDHHEWEAAIFGRYNSEKVFVIGGNDWYQCIPFEGNEHLLDTTEEPNDFFVTWG